MAISNRSSSCVGTRPFRRPSGIWLGAGDREIAVNDILALIPSFGECIVNLASLCRKHKFDKEVIFMDPVENPYSPDAGSPPPELAGRDQIRTRERVSIYATRVGTSAKTV